MSITAKLTSERSAFNASMTTSKGIIEASITEEIGAFNAFINTSTRIPDHLEIEGDWNGYCVCGDPVSENIQNMVFKCVYRNGSYSLCTPTPSPEVWGDTEGEQTVTFSYEEGGVVITASKSAHVYKPKPVGGILFYIDSTADGEYLFWDNNNNIVDAPSIGTDCTGWTYSVLEYGSKDKFYVMHNQLYTSLRWTYYRNGSPVYETLNTSTPIGSGKTNTYKVMNTDGGAYITSDSSGIPTIWYTIQQIRTNLVGGCDDWFVGSIVEVDQIRLSNVGDSATWFSDETIWSSSESVNTARFWSNSSGRWGSAVKSSARCVIPIRSFGALELVSLSVSGTWQNTQYKGAAVDYTGLVFTATFSDRSTQIVTPTVKPSVWSESGMQTATFSYTFNGITKSVTSSVEVISSWEGLPVGGIIFYIDNTADGTYTFHNANDEEVSAPAVGTDCTGWTYMVEGATKDKYYVVHNQLYTSKIWGGAGTAVGASSSSIGSGRTNTAKAIGSVADVTGSIWELIRAMRSNEIGGCDDWYAGSRYELEALYGSNAGDSASWFASNFMWTSTENGANYAWYWHGSSHEWGAYRGKGNSSCICGIRSF